MLTDEKENTADSLQARSALLDFWADRAAGFASLFVASIFGLVTVLALGQQIVSNGMSPPLLYWVTVTLSFVSFIAFAGAGLYVWGRFAYYAELAQILSDEIIEKHAKLDEVKITQKPQVKSLLANLNEKERKDEKNLNLYNYYRRVAGLKQDTSRTRKYVIRYFRWLYAILILILALVVYLPALARVLKWV